MATLQDPVLSSGQYSIDGLVFGLGTVLPISNTAYDSGTPTVQDTPLVNADGRRFGVDFYPGTTITFTGQALTVPAVPYSTMDAYATMAAAWTNQRVRRTPGAVQVLRCLYPGSQVVRRVYGRGRRIAPTLGLVKQGWKGFTAEFDSADNTFYSDALQTLTLGGIPNTTTGGVAPPLTPPVVLASVWSTINLVQPADSAFELPWTGNWNPDLLLTGLQQDTSHYATGATSMLAQISAAGTSQWTLLTMLPVIAGTRYQISAQLLADVGMAGSCTLQALCYNNVGGLVSTQTIQTQNSVVNSWVPYTGQFTIPTNVVSIQLRFRYAAPAAGRVWTDTIIVSGGPQTLWTPYNGGDQDTWPTISFFGPGTNPTISYPVSGVSVWYQGTLAFNETLTIYTMPWARGIMKTRGVGIDVSGPLNDEVSALLQPLQLNLMPSPTQYANAGAMRGSPLDRLVLGPGSTPVAFTVQDTTSTARCQISWRNGWTTIGGSLP